MEEDHVYQDFETEAQNKELNPFSSFHTKSRKATNISGK